MCIKNYRKSGNFHVKKFHVIIFRVKIFLYASRPYENILTTKMSTKWLTHMYVGRRESCIHGQHIYKDIANPLGGEVLQCNRDSHNMAD